MLATDGREPGQVYTPIALVVDTAGNLYVAEARNGGHGCTDFGTCNDRIQQRDAQGIWSVIAGSGSGLGEVHRPYDLAVDTAGNLYVADHRIQKRDAQGNWSVIVTAGSALGQVDYGGGLAVDTSGNLYVEDTGNRRVLKYTPSP